MQHNVSTNKMKDSIKDNGKWAAGQVQDTAKKIYDQAVEAGSDFISTANKRVPELVREYPVYATLGGLCLGFLLGASLVSVSRRTSVISE